MVEQTLTRWVKTGYPHLKECSGLPAWLLPQSSTGRVADELGGSGILEMSRPLGLADGIEGMLERAPDPDKLPSEVWQEAVLHWPPLSQVRSIVEAFLEASDKIMGQFHSGQLKAEPTMICRSMAVLLFAPFLHQGRPLLEELASILEGDAERPAELITRYAEAVIQGDILSVEEINDCLTRYSQWSEWTAIFQKHMLNFSYTPRLIAVAPPLSAELADVLASMIKERQDDEPGRDYP